MSYILEALKKSERERRLGAVPRLDTSQEPAPTPPRQAGRNWLLPILAVNLLLLAGILAYLVLQPAGLPESAGHRAQPVRSGESAAPADPPARAATTADSSAHQATGPTPLAPSTDAQANRLSRREQAEQGEQGEQGEQAITPPTTLPAAGQTDQTPAATSMPGQEGARGSTADQSAPALAASAPPAVPASLAAPPPTTDTIPPRLSELPDHRRSQITAPTLEIHVYSENPERRFVMIRGRQYREGDRLPDELRLEEITPTGATLSHHGQSFRLER